MLSEIQSYVERLQDRRAGVLKALAGVDADGLNWKPLAEDTNSLAVLATHSLGSERHWLHEVIGGNKIERDRAAEFRSRAEDITSLQAMYKTVALESERILAALTPAGLDAECNTGDRTNTARWCILHVLEHYSEHLAQMWLTRQLWDNRSSRPHEI